MAVVRFGVFEIDEKAGEMRRQGRRLHIATQPLKALILLASRSGEVVSRDELRRHLWGDDTFVEFDRSLNFCIAEIRRVLGDDARNARFIETVPKRGYRFLADVHGVDGPASWPAVASVAPDTGADRGVAWRRWAAVVIVPIVLAQQPVDPPAHTRATADPQSLAAFQRASRFPNDAAGQRDGITALQAATRIDPRFAEAHFALAHLYFELAKERELPPKAAIVEARAAAERAVALEEAPESRQLLGTIRLVADWDWPGAQRDLARAVALEPNWAIGWAAYARVLSAVGDDAAAVDAIDRAETLNPTGDLILFDAGQIYARARRYDEALDKLERAVQFGPPEHTTATDWMKRVRYRQLTIDIARQDWKSAHALAASIVAASGADEEMQRRFEALDPAVAIEAFLRRSVAMNTSSGRRVAGLHIAALEALRGNSARALDWLERAAREHDPDLVYVLRDPEFLNLRSQPRYQALDLRVRGSAHTPTRELGS